MKRRARPAAQLALPTPRPPPGRGGFRKCAGRKPTRPGRRLPHTPRPWHDQAHPLHITLRVDRRGHLRRVTPARAIGKAVRAATRESTVPLDLFRVAQFSIQHDHIHLIVESSSKQALARGMKGLACRVAKTLNRTTRRRGSRSTVARSLVVRRLELFDAEHAPAPRGRMRRRCAPHRAQPHDDHV